MHYWDYTCRHTHNQCIILDYQNALSGPQCHVIESIHHDVRVLDDTMEIPSSAVDIGISNPHEFWQIKSFLPIFHALLRVHECH